MILVFTVKRRKVSINKSSHTNIMIQFKEEEVCRLMRSVTYYRDNVTGNDDMWDRYNDLITKLSASGEEASPAAMSCTDK